MLVFIPILFFASSVVVPQVSPESRPPGRAIVVESAHKYGVDPDRLVCLWVRESDRGAELYGDLDEETGEYLALGPFQYHRESWVLVRRHMGRDPDWRLALDLREAAETTAYALGVMGLGRWWATDGLCKEAT